MLMLMLMLVLMSMLMSFTSVDFFVLSFVLSCVYAYYVTSEDQALLILYCVLSHDLFSVYLWEYLKFRMKFAANLNLKGHQFFLLTLYNNRCSFCIFIGRELCVIKVHTHG